MMSTGKCGLKLYDQNNILEKKITNMRLRIIFGGPDLGRFCWCFFYFFVIDQFIRYYNKFITN